MSVATVNTKEKISCKTEFQAFDHLMKSVKNDADILLSPATSLDIHWAPFLPKKNHIFSENFNF